MSKSSFLPSNGEPATAINHPASALNGGTHGHIYIQQKLETPGEHDFIGLMRFYNGLRASWPER